MNNFMYIMAMKKSVTQQLDDFGVAKANLAKEISETVLGKMFSWMKSKKWILLTSTILWYGFLILIMIALSYKFFFVQ